MSISIFLRGKNFYIAADDFDSTFTVSESRFLADELPGFLKDCLHDASKYSTLIYSSGPGSFTTNRIVNSVVKAFFLAFPQMKFVGMSNFLTYAAIASESYTEARLAIPTMRGDYFTSTYSNGILSDIRIEKLDEEEVDQILFDNNENFSNVNLAIAQKKLFDGDFFKNNSKFVKENFSIDYGFTPEYRY